LLEPVELRTVLFPAFTTLPNKEDPFTYRFNPSLPSHMGNFTLRGAISNKWGTLPFFFIVEVFNLAPIFSDSADIIF
jgi:hypothetical protein